MSEETATAVLEVNRQARLDGLRSALVLAGVAAHPHNPTRLDLRVAFGLTKERPRCPVSMSRTAKVWPGVGGSLWALPVISLDILVISALAAPGATSRPTRLSPGSEANMVI